jgi:hypothetical protein
MVESTRKGMHVLTHYEQVDLLLAFDVIPLDKN